MEDLQICSWLEWEKKFSLQYYARSLHHEQTVAAKWAVDGHYSFLFVSETVWWRYHL